MEPANNDLQPPANIDLSQYQTAELADRIAELVSVPRRVRTLATCGAGGLVVALIVVTLVFGPRVHWTVLTGLLVYSTLTAVGIGVLLGLLITFNKSLDGAVDLFDISLSISRQAIGDLDEVREGKRNVDAGRLLHAVHDDVVMPVVEKVICRQSRWLGRLFVPLYRASIGRMTKHVLSRVVDDEAAPETRLPLHQATDNAATDVESLATILDRSRALLQRAHDFVTRRGDQLRRLVIFPLCVLLALLVLVALTPLVVALVVTLVA